jgi:hypothetical protein
MQTEVINEIQLDPKTREFYCQTLKTLNASGIPYLVGGAFAFERFTGIKRQTKDIDIFVLPEDCDRILSLFASKGYETYIHSPHWLAKACYGDDFVDIIFNSANGIDPVDDEWFKYAVDAKVLGIPTKICPAEETICSKAFVMARDRFDGADIAHLILRCHDILNWERLLKRFGDNWRVLFSHLILFEFIYPQERSRIPNWVMQELLQRLQTEINTSPPPDKICQGTLLAPLQYFIDLEHWGYQDARLHPQGNLTTEEISQWTEALKEEKQR